MKPWPWLSDLLSPLLGRPASDAPADGTIPSLKRGPSRTPIGDGYVARFLADVMEVTETMTNVSPRLVERPFCIELFMDDMEYPFAITNGDVIYKIYSIEGANGKHTMIVRSSHAIPLETKESFRKRFHPDPVSFEELVDL